MIRLWIPFLPLTCSCRSLFYIIEVRKADVDILLYQSITRVPTMNACVYRETLFTSGSALSAAVTQVCEVSKDAATEDEAAAATSVFEERSLKIRERFISLAQRYWATLPSSSTGGTITDSMNGNEAAENLIDIIWTVDQAFENGQSVTSIPSGGATGQASSDIKPVNKLGLLVKELNVSL